MTSKKKKPTDESQRKFFGFVIVCVIIVGALFLLFNEAGFLRYRQIKNEVDSLVAVNDTLKQQNQLLQGSIDSLKQKIPAKIEKVAREKYNLKKPNETIVPVEEK